MPLSGTAALLGLLAATELNLDALRTDDSDRRVRTTRFVDELFAGKATLDRRTFREKVLEHILRLSPGQLEELRAQHKSPEDCLELSAERAFIDYMQRLPQPAFDREFVLRFLLDEVFENEFGARVFNATRAHRGDSHGRGMYEGVVRAAESLSLFAEL